MNVQEGEQEDKHLIWRDDAQLVKLKTGKDFDFYLKHEDNVGAASLYLMTNDEPDESNMNQNVQNISFFRIFTN